MFQRLFVVKDNAGVTVAQHYNKKRDAKAYRDEFGPDGKYHVSLGPDHWRFSQERKPNAVKRKRNRK